MDIDNVIVFSNENDSFTISGLSRSLIEDIMFSLYAESRSIRQEADKDLQENPRIAAIEQKQADKRYALAEKLAVNM